MPTKKIIECESIPININHGDEYLILQQNPNTYTHGYFKYPCKFIPEIPNWFFKKYLKQGDTVIDPFAGSGTTLLEASIQGVDSFGIEISEFSKLLIQVKTTKLNSLEIDIVKQFLENINLNIGYKFPDIDNLEHWFDEDNLIKLAILKSNIDEVENVNVTNFLKICFSSIIRKCSKADNVSPKPYVSTKIKKLKLNPYVEFGKIVNTYLNGNISLTDNNVNLSKTETIIGSAIKFNLENKFDAAITSPPYINAFDYVRILRLETLWLGLASEKELRESKKKYVGTESLSTKFSLEQSILNESKLLKKYYHDLNEIDKKRAHILLNFFNDMKSNLNSVHASLKDSGVYAIVIGNSKIRGMEIESWRVLQELGERNGFVTDIHFSYIIRNHYLRIDRKNLGGKINSDFILVLRKNDGTER